MTDMTNARTARPAETIYDMIDRLAELGFSPADEDAPKWVASYFGGFAARPFEAGWLIVGESVDEVLVTATTASGVIREQLRYSAPDGVMGGIATVAMFATLCELVACD